MNPRPSWQLRLSGTACVNCGQPAHRLLVFPAGRVIVHGPAGGPPCRLANPVDTDLLDTTFTERRAA